MELVALNEYIKNNTIAVIPAYNEGNRIENVIKICSKFVKNAIVVDDGSTDLTYENAKKTGATVIRHKYNKGKGHALRTGIRYLLNHKPQYVVFLDADGQDNPNFIPGLVKPLVENKADIVLGSRFVNEGRPEVPVHKVIGNKLLTFIMNFLTGFLGVITLKVRRQTKGLWKGCMCTPIDGNELAHTLFSSVLE